jgi:hypothetical protein
MNQLKKPRDLDDIKTPTEAWEEATNGSLRWIALVLTLLTAILMIWIRVDPEGDSFIFPTKGPGVWIFLTASLVLWVSMAILNWRTWARSRKR